MKSEIKSILMGFAPDTDAIHSPNENYPLINFFRGIEAIPLFFKAYSTIEKQYRG
jgi:acetylornithine deacetylase/succinyl-diaminopimelate desuccinylase-like protein